MIGWQRSKKIRVLFSSIFSKLIITEILVDTAAPISESKRGIAKPKINVPDVLNVGF